jgi:multisubunit Na+/H+ antiporter MnhG subunit
MNGIDLGAISGVVLSLAFAYLPGLNEWYAKLSKQYKQTVMGVLLIVVAVSVFALQCSGVKDFGLICSQAGAIQFFEVLIAALVANQSIYPLIKK